MGERVLAPLFTGGLTIAIVATVLSLGMSFPVAALLAPLRRVRVVAAMVGLNAVVLPAGAWGLAKAAPIGEDYVGGIALAAIGAAGAAGLKAAELSRRADLPLAVWLVIVLQLANLVAVPLWAAAVVTGASISPLRISQSLLLIVLLPLVAGVIARVRWAAAAATLRPWLFRVGNVALVVAVLAGVVANRDVLPSVLGSWILPTALAIVALGLGLGFLVGGGDGPTRITTSLVSGTRFSALGLIIVGTQYPDRPAYLASAITFALVDFVVMLGAAVAIRRQVLRRPGIPRAAS